MTAIRNLSKLTGSRHLVDVVPLWTQVTPRREGTRGRGPTAQSWRHPKREILQSLPVHHAIPKRMLGMGEWYTRQHQRRMSAVHR